MQLDVKEELDVIFKRFEKSFLEANKKPMMTFHEDVLNLANKVGVKFENAVEENGKKNKKNKPAKKRTIEEVKKEEEEDDDENNEDGPVKDFICAGRVWEDPQIPCPGGPKSHVKAGTQIEDANGKKKNITICHSCKLARQKIKRAKKNTTNNKE